MEDHSLDKTFDNCLANFLVKGGVGLTTGIVASIFFKRKLFPIGLGTGIGLGVAQQQCQVNFDRINAQMQ